MRTRTAGFLPVLIVLAMILSAVLPVSAFAWEDDAAEYTDRLESCAAQIRDISDITPDVVLVTASSLGYLADDMEIDAEIPYEEIEGFPVPTADGHEGKLLLGTLKGVPVVVLSGRVHYYEGYDMWDVVFPLRVAYLLGARTAVLTTTVGAVDTDFAPGDLAVVTDHIASFLPSPLAGENIDALGERFVDMTRVYDEELSALVKQLGEDRGVTVGDGVLIEVTGPQYETPAEIRMYEVLGADLASMSTVDEAIAARHMGMRVCAVALVTNMAAGVEPAQIERADVARAAAEVEADFRDLIDDLISHLAAPLAADVQVETVETDSFSMDYVRFGHGEKTLVILPGLSVQSVMGSADAIAEAYELFTEDYTVYLFDRRKELPDAYSVYDMARDTAEAIQALGLESVSLMGVSQGGMMAMDIAIRNPELVDKLVLGSASARVTEEQYETMDAWAQLARDGDAEGLYLAFGEALYPEEMFKESREMLIEAAKTVTDGELERFILLSEAAQGFDVSDELEQISCPVLLIGSLDDRVLGADATAQIAERLEGKSDFELYMYDGYGHAAYDTAPDYKERVLGFLTSGSAD